MYIRQLILFLFFGYYCHATLQLLSPPFINESWYCTSMTRFLGPQPGDNSAAVIAPLHYFIADPCKAASITRYEVQGKAIYVPICGCSEDRVYYNLAEKGAAAVIRTTSFQPGSDYNTRALQAEISPRNDMPYVQVPPLAFDDSGRFEGATVSIILDPNIWVPYHQSWQWQTFLRWLPGAMYCFGAVLAVIFLIRRFYDDCQRYYQQTPKSIQHSSEAFRYGLSKANLSHLALIIEIIKCPVMAFVCMVGGEYSTPNLPDQVNRFFVTQLSGWTFVTTMISARTWHRATHRHSHSNTFLSKVLGDSCYSHIFIAMTAAPFLLDFMISVLYVVYIPNEYPILDFIVGGIFFVLKLLVGSLFLQQSATFLLNAYKNAAALDVYAPYQDHKVKRQLFYQSLYALGVGISIGVYISGTLLVIVACTYFSYPQGYLVSFAQMTVGQAMETIFHIMLFRPAPRVALQQLESLSKQ